MKTDNFFVIKINVERIIIAIVVSLAILFAIILGVQNSRIRTLKYELIMKQGQNRNLKNKVEDLERDKRDLEGQNSDLENRIYELESYQGY